MGLSVTVPLQGVVGDRLFMFDAATSAPMLGALIMLGVLVAEQQKLQVQADYSL